MKYIDEFQDRELVQNLIHKISQESHTPVTFMEVCGGHTMAIQRFGIPSLLPNHIKLISGPGCPVCVTSIKYIDKAIALATQPDTIVATYGDLIRVPGSTSSLDKEKSNGADVRIVYSSLDALQMAREFPEKHVVFLGIGFETTAPTTAAAVNKAYNQHISNFYILSAHKIMPPAMQALIDEGVNIDGYIAPGHVSTITGTKIYEDIPAKYNIPCVVSGFEPVDLLQSISLLIEQTEKKTPKVEIAYKRAVHKQGNQKARAMMHQIFEYVDNEWRGLGLIPKSGLGLKEKYSGHDAEKVFSIPPPEANEPKGCICGAILKGLKTPADCPLFANSCIPENPVGACMVSSEGACQAFYRYNRT